MMVHLIVTWLLCCRCWVVLLLGRAAGRVLNADHHLGGADPGPVLSRKHHCGGHPDVGRLSPSPGGQRHPERQVGFLSIRERIIIVKK